MIAIISNSPRERAAFAALCESRDWPCNECESLHAFRRLLRQMHPKVVLSRHRLPDGYSDDVIAALRADDPASAAKIIVLVEPGIRATEEARQVCVGADYVHRDPVRTDVLLEYLTKYRTAAKNAQARSRRPTPRAFSFAGATVDPVDRWIGCGRKRRHITPREVELIELLAEFAGGVVSYATLYCEILGRRFRGETSNMRVLLGKLDASFRALGLSLRAHVTVIPKTGYRYLPDSPAQGGMRQRGGGRNKT